MFFSLTPRSLIAGKLVEEKEGSTAGWMVRTAQQPMYVLAEDVVNANIRGVRLLPDLRTNEESFAVDGSQKGT